MDAFAPVERRIVTVLFADIVGFTTLSEGLDPEDVATVQDAYFGLVRETMERYGGRLEKFIGDAAVAVFGLPRTRDDDAERAVRAGLALTAGVEALSGRLGLEAGTLAVRVGVNTGEVAHATSGPDQDRITGDTVNVAARLQGAADPGTVLAGEMTCLAVADAIALSDRRSLDLKGKSTVVVARQAMGVRPERSRDHAMGSLHAPTLGRQEELVMLRAAAVRAHEGAPERWTIIAPPGVGKSRLVDEVARGVPDRSIVWRIRLRADQVGPYEPVADLMRMALAGADPAHVPLEAAGVDRDRAVVLRAAVQGLMAPSQPASATMDASDIAEGREQRFDAWLDVLDALATDRSQVWIVDDVHWAGGDVLAFLVRAGVRQGGRGRLIVATARPSLLERAPDWPEQAGGRRMDLASLAPADASALVRALVGDALPDHLVDSITERADGSPLFIEELLRTWVSVGALEPDPDHAWRLAVEPHGLSLPPTVHAIYAAQLDDLPAAARNVATRGSVAGRRIPLDALPHLGVEAVASREGVDVLAKRAFVAGPDQEDVTGTTYSFRHALLRDAGYARLARAERARLHVRLARWLEEAAGERSAAVAELIGRHYLTALESAPTLSTSVDGSLDRAATSRLAAGWLERASEHSLALTGYDAAVALLRVAVDTTPPDDRLDRARRLLRLGQALAPSGDVEAAQAALAEARAMYDAERSGPHADTARDGFAAASAAASQSLLEQLRFRDGAVLAGEALERIGHGADPAAARLALAKANGDFFESNDPQPLMPALERILGIARSHGDRELELEALRLRINALAEQGLASAQEDEALIGLAMDLGRWPVVVNALRNRAAMSMDHRLAEVAPLLEEAERVARAHGQTQSLTWIAFTRAEAAMLGGDWDEALRRGDEALALGIANGYVRATVRTWFSLRPIIAWRRDLERAARMAAWFAALPSVPDSLYGRLMHAAIDLDVHAILGGDPPIVDPARLRDAWVLPYDDPSWVAARDRVLGAWWADGSLGNVRAANAAVATALTPDASALARGAERLWAARLLNADGSRTASSATARDAMVLFRRTFAVWWVAQCLDLIMSLGQATDEDREELSRIRDRLAGTTASTSS